MTPNEEQAFPTEFDNYAESGLSKREYFAAMALQGLLSGNKHADLVLSAKTAVDAADYLIKELNRAS